MKSRKSMISLGKGFIFALGLLIISDIESKTQPKRTPRTRQLKPAPKPSAAPAQKPAEPTPTPAPSYLSSEEFSKMMSIILSADSWSPEIDQLYRLNLPKLSTEQYQTVQAAYHKILSTRALQGEAAQLQQDLNLAQQQLQLQRQIARIQRSRALPEGIQAKPKTTGYFESLFDYEGLIAKLLPEEWTGAKAAALAAAMGTAGAVIALFVPQLSADNAATAAMAALSAGGMYAAISRGIDRLQKGAWTIDAAIENVAQNVEQEMQNKAEYPTIQSQLNGINEGDFKNLLNVDENIWHQGLLRVASKIEEKQKNIDENLSKVAEQQARIDDAISGIKMRNAVFLDDLESYVVKIEEEYPYLLDYRAALSEYLRAHKRIAIIKAQQVAQESAPQMKPIEPAPTITQPVQQPAPVTPTQQPVQPVSPSSQTPGIYPSLAKITSESTPQPGTPAPSAPLVETPTETPVAKEPASESWIPSWLSGLR